MSNLIPPLDLGVVQSIPLHLGLVEIVIKHSLRLLKASASASVATDHGIKVECSRLSKVEVIYFIRGPLLIVEVCDSLCNQPFIERQENRVL